MVTLINGLDLSLDVLRYSAPTTNITAPKNIKKAEVNDLYCQNYCTLQQVDITEWIAKAALVLGNYTIQGTTVIENPIFYGDIRYTLYKKYKTSRHEYFVSIAYMA